MFLRDTITFSSTRSKIVLYTIFTLILAFTVFTLYRVPHFLDQNKTKDIVATIHATKLTLDDVMGENLPPDPGALADKTIAGVDANHNGIRDDVELAIFKQYPDSAKTRAVLLQYALAMQMEFSLPIINTETVTALIEDNQSRAEICMWTLSSRSDMKKFNKDIDRYEDFIKNIQINTEQRKKYDTHFYEYLRSYSSSNESCDIDLLRLSH